MCGVAGYADSTQRPARADVVEAMVKRLRHRGPDGERVQVVRHNPAVVLGHTRLAVIDLSEAGAQPMSGCSPDVCVVYNGEIYNHDELRRDLVASGHAFRTRTDTEVIAHLLEELGPAEALARLDGMFAFAAFVRGRVVLARDRVGKKPLFYITSGDRLTFASEVKALRVAPWVDATVDERSLARMLVQGHLVAPDTVHRGIHELEPGCFLLAAPDGVTTQERFAPPPWEASGRGPASSAEEVRRLIQDAVAKRLQADRPLGVLLSGGVDSAAIVAAMARAGATPRTFTAAAGPGSWDERAPAARIARHFATPHVELDVGTPTAEVVDRVVWHLDQPMPDSSAVPTWMIARAAAEHVTVVLTGDGGDDVFGGYERFAALHLAAMVPGGLARRAGAVAERLRTREGYFDPVRRIRRFASAAGRSPAHAYRAWTALFDDALASRLFGLREPVAPFQRDLRPVDAAMRDNYTTYLPGDLLVKMDRMTMAHGLEARSPLLDTRVAQAAFALPAARHVRVWPTKRLFRRAVSPWLPARVTWRAKHGFGVPAGRWMRENLAGLFADTVLSPQARIGRYADTAVIDELWRGHLGGRDHGQRLWALLVAETWLRQLEADSSGVAP